MEHKIRVLIVEDEALIAENLSQTLEDLGYGTAGICYTFREAQQAIADVPAELVLLDINLGSNNADENGIALGRIINAGARKPFIFLTAYSDRDIIESAAKMRPGGYLIKPVNPAALFATIQTAMYNHVQEQTPLSDQPPARPDYFFVRIGLKNHRLLWRDVYCIESGKNYVRLRIRNSPTEYPIRGTLAFVTEQLIPVHLQQDFLRISRSVCVNMQMITTYSGDQVCCGDNCFENTRFSVKELHDLLGR